MCVWCEGEMCVCEREGVDKAFARLRLHDRRFPVMNLAGIRKSNVCVCVRDVCVREVCVCVRERE